MGQLKHPKRSFVRLAVEVDATRLAADFAELAGTDWQPSYWTGPHCSIEMILLRGGTQNNPMDFKCEAVADRPILARLPYIRQLLAESGPFGGTKYAFIFRMQPYGVSRLHVDQDPAWFDLYRVHIPLETGPESYLVADGQRAQHFEVGEVWSFHNQEIHGVLNGDCLRTHLIFDVAPNDKIGALLETAEYHHGVAMTDAQWARVSWPERKEAPVIPFSTVPLSAAERDALGLATHWPVSRVTHVRPNSVDGLQKGDVLAVETAAAVPDRDVAQHLATSFSPGAQVSLLRIRDGQKHVVMLPPLQTVAVPPARKTPAY